MQWSKRKRIIVLSAIFTTLLVLLTVYRLKGYINSWRRGALERTLNKQGHSIPQGWELAKSSIPVANEVSGYTIWDAGLERSSRPWEESDRRLIVVTSPSGYVLIDEIGVLLPSMPSVFDINNDHISEVFLVDGAPIGQTLRVVGLTRPVTEYLRVEAGSTSKIVMNGEAIDVGINFLDSRKGCHVRWNTATKRFDCEFLTDTIRGFRISGPWLGAVSVATRPEDEQIAAHHKPSQTSIFTLEPKDIAAMKDLGPWHELSIVRINPLLHSRREFLRIEYAIIKSNLVPVGYRQLIDQTRPSVTVFRISNTKGRRLLWLDLELECDNQAIKLELVDTDNRPLGLAHMLVDLPSCKEMKGKILRTAEK